MTTRDDEFPYPLATTDWLAAHLFDDDIKIVDASWRMPGNPPARLDHEKRRIPGAAFFDIDEVADRSTGLPHMHPTADEFAKAAGAMGISQKDRVIIYDDAGIFSAARAWWTFHAMGHETVAVLDGGLPKWLAEKRPIETGAAAPKSVPYSVGAPKRLARSANDVRAFLKKSAGVVLDARPAARFAGEAPEPRPGLRRGHMPGAVSFPHSLLIAETGEMKPLHELAKLFHDRGVHAETDVITTCGSGVTAAVLALALERLGHRRHALYDGSWTEWGAETNDLDLFPVTTG